MDKTKIIIVFITSIIILLPSIILLIYLFIKKNKYPYIHINSFWERYLIMLIIFEQIFSIYYNLFIDEKIELFYIMKEIKVYILDILINITIIARVYNIYLLISNNYLFISGKIIYNSDEFDEKEKKEKLFSKNYNKNFINLKLILIIKLIYILIVVFLLTIYYNNFLEFVKFFYKEKITVSIKLTLYYLNIIYLNILFIISTIYKKIKKYNIKKDKFYCIKEVHYLLILTYINSTIKLIIFLIYVNNSKLPKIILDSIFNFLYIILFSFLTLKRIKRFKAKHFLSIIDDIDLFLSTRIRFNRFQKYISKKYEDSLKLLSFYADYNSYKQIIFSYNKKVKLLYKNKIKSISMNNRNSISDVDISLNQNELFSIEKEEELIREKAKRIYNDYFGNINISNQSKGIDMIIEFPIDIYEKVNNAYDLDFNIKDIDNIFNEAFGWVKEKLIIVFKEYSNNSNELEKMKKIIFFIDCFEENEL